jgi:serine protease
MEDCGNQVAGCDDQAPPRPPVNLRPRGKPEDYSGFVVIRLRPGLGPGKSEDLREVSGELGLRTLSRFLEELGDVTTRRLITSVSPPELLRLEEEAHKSIFGPLRSLTAYWRIDCRDLLERIEEIVATLNQIPEVDLAYREQSVSEAVNPTDDPFSVSQNYLDPAPTGIDARWAWTQANGDGAGVGFVDLEQGWIPTHEDLTAKTPTLIFNSNMNGVGTYVGNHGTAVLGEVVGVDNTLGVVGIATGVTSVRMTSHYDGATNLHVADAIVAAIAVMPAGDVLLLEVQRGALPLPTETDDGDFDAIRLAVARGVIVVEAAGNGNNNLDTWTDSGGNSRLNRGSAAFLDSGAIMVGAGNSTLPHDRASFSNYGSRNDCYAWGDAIVSCGYGDLAGTNDNNRYTAIFGGTSGASPIITGAALVLQAMYQGSTGGFRLSPGQMRALLSNAGNGTAQGGGVAGNIGVMPNLKAIAQNALGLVPDVYMRDYVGDPGMIPSVGTISVSPDVIVRPSPVANPTASFGEASGTANDDTLGSQVESGQDNTVYVRMRNRGAAGANSVRATVYWSEVATLVAPTSWNLIGTTAPVSVPTGNTLVVTDGLTWSKASLPPAGTHACFVAVLDDPQDPAPPIPAATDWDGFVAMIRNQNNVTWRNFDVINVLADPRADPAIMEFVIAGAPDEPRRFDLEILQDLPDDVSVRWDVAPGFVNQIPDALLARAEAAVGKDGIGFMLPRLPALPLCGVLIPAGARLSCRFVVQPGKGLARGTHRVAIRQVWGGVEVGRVTWALRVVTRRRGIRAQPAAATAQRASKRAGGRAVRGR